ncbi:MAG: phospholipase D-like domain-containing protein [Fervidobacterium sp.]
MSSMMSSIKRREEKIKRIAKNKFLLIFLILFSTISALFALSVVVKNVLSVSNSSNIFFNIPQKNLLSNISFQDYKANYIDVYFTEDGPIVDKVLEFMRNSKNYLFVSALDVSHNIILNELYHLKEKGIDVRVITEKPVLGLPSKIDFSGGLHHVKFIVNDYGVLFGSSNFSDSGLVSGFNDMILFPRTFSDKFRKFFLNIWDEGLVTGVEGFLVSPIDKVEENVLKRLSKARKKIWVCVYAFSDMNILSMLKYKASCGVDVKMVVDKWIWSSKIGKLPLENTKIVTSRMLHHKFIIIDDTLVTGSTNYTESGFHKNVEMIWVTKDKRLVKRFEEIFKKLYNYD